MLLFIRYSSPSPFLNIIISIVFVSPPRSDSDSHFSVFCLFGPPQLRFLPMLIHLIYPINLINRSSHTYPFIITYVIIIQYNLDIPKST